LVFDQSLVLYIDLDLMFYVFVVMAYGAYVSLVDTIL